MYFKDEKISLYYEKYGNDKKTILILPGWGNTRPTFKNIIEHFKINYTIYIIDYPGFGNSPIPNTDLTIYDYANTIRNFMNKQKITNPILIVHSFGGRIATLLTGYYKEKIDKLIMIDAAAIKPKKTLKQLFKQTLYKSLKKLIQLTPKKIRNNLKQKLFQKFASTDYKNLTPCMQKTFRNIVNEDLTIYLKKIESETLLIWGSLDNDTPLKDAEKMNKLIKNSALIIYKNATHYSYLQYPYLTNNIINEFIK